jgi:hypothetical protein
LLLVGVAFSAGFVPWITRYWQNKQRALDIRTDLVADMSKCVMRFVAQLEHLHSPRESGQAPAALRSSESGQSNDILTQCYSEFHVKRCIIGTKLEVYYPKEVHGEKISKAWTNFADLLTRLYEFNCHNNHRCAGFEAELLCKFEKRLNTDLSKLGAREKSDAINVAELHADVVCMDWGKPEQLLLAEKARLIRTVLRTHVSLSSRPRWLPSMWRRFSHKATEHNAAS